MKSMFGQVTKDFFWRVIFTLSKQGVVFYIYILTARSLSQELFGIYNYILSALFFLILFCDFGVSTATSKYVAQYHGTDQEKLKDVVFNTLLMVCLFVGVAACLVLGFGAKYFHENFQYFLGFSPLIFLVPAVSIYDGIYRGLKRFREGALMTLIGGLLLVVLAPFLISYKGIWGSIVAQIIFYGFLLFLFFIGYLKNLRWKFNSVIIKEIGKYSLLYGLAVMSYQIFARIDVQFLGSYGYLKEVATYELLNKLFSILVIPFTLLGQVFAPRYTECFYVRKDYQGILKSVTRYTVIFLASSAMIGLVCFFTVPFLVGQFFSQYLDQSFREIFVVSLLIFCINVTTATIDHGMIVATGYAKLMTWLYSGLAIVNLLINFFAVKAFGYMGVLYATLFCVTAMVFILRILFIFELKKIVRIKRAQEDVSFSV